MRKGRLYRAMALAIGLLLTLSPAVAYADEGIRVGVKETVAAEGEYANWEGVSNVSQFQDADGNYCFAYPSSGKAVTIVRTKDGEPQEKTVKLKRQKKLFGGVACDVDGNYYLVEGQTNSSSDSTKNTVFISKFDSKGKLIKTVGDNGSSSLGSWYPKEFHTKIPFDGGNCDIAINGNYLAVNYAREMYNGHQSNSVFVINRKTMKKYKMNDIYSSHSFAQRAVPFEDGFVFASEGDAYSRAFTVSAALDVKSGSSASSDVFHFWIKKNSSGNMYVVNDNFAHMGDLVRTKGHVALVGSSVKALSSKASSQNEQIFVQIFNPKKDLGKASAYSTSGKRSGLSGMNGDVKVTDYGVKWLTSYSKEYEISHPQAAADESGRIAILYELYKSGKYEGVYSMTLDAKGNVVRKKARYSSTAKLNPCETPICLDGTVYWTANSTEGDDLLVYRLEM